MTIKVQLTHVPKKVAERLLDQDNVSIRKDGYEYVLETDNLIDFSAVMVEVEKIKTEKGVNHV